ncbi:hypothetical protein [Alicyclobacillus tolerans]|uniref:Uncharacterized protein n=2 Tax=Alicyclobacillus tolerans TaxID=90970 RepID=A0ABT9LZ54_9BACL|nr:MULTISPECIES: hypothetical protein [Alicyclobacillus]MDP9729530.1 hypothetical protein [Alicyclobacillus tengchongensis]SHK20302.1 hypothetical protein SAMN05443507_11022 [Alicyclobacillus montanus]
MDDLSPSLHDRTMQGIQSVIDRVFQHVQGMEKIIINRSIQMIYPRLEQRIRAASEDELLTELQFVHDLIEKIMPPKPPEMVIAKKKSKKRKNTRLISRKK